MLRRPAAVDNLAGPADWSRLSGDVLAAAVVVGVFWVPPTLAAGGSAGSAVGWVLATATGAALVLRQWLPTASTVVVGVVTVVGNAPGVRRGRRADRLFALLELFYEPI